MRKDSRGLGHVMNLWKQAKPMKKGDKKEVAHLRVTVKNIFTQIMGTGFRYEIGSYSPYFDLMIYSGLMNRAAMAEYFWGKCENPVGSAVLMCVLFRKLSRRADIDPMSKREMILAADIFEEKAVGIQTTAEHDDMIKAISAASFAYLCPLT